MRTLSDYVHFFFSVEPWLSIIEREWNADYIHRTLRGQLAHFVPLLESLTHTTEYLLSGWALLN
jgi:hypothetical protein